MGQPSHLGNRLQAMTLSQVLQTLREEDNIDVLLQTSLSYLQAKFNYRLIWIGLYDRLDHQLVGKGGITPDGERSFLHQRFSLTPGELLEQMVVQLQPIAIANL
ncbi:MAG: ATP-binding protein, partial [Cyanobacteriota bacterium]|nr:ATP-binding protein [Cyanobacteriota bacterium]